MKDKAFELIFREYNRMITAYLYSLVRDGEEALDLTQEVFVVAYRKMAETDSSQSLAGWLRSIAWNLAANELRRRRRHVCHTLDGGEMERTFALLDQPQADQVWEERLKALDRCMDRLPDGQRKAVELFYQLGESARAIAAKLGVVEATVFQFMWQARKNLRNCIERAVGGSAEGQAAR